MRKPDKFYQLLDIHLPPHFPVPTHPRSLGRVLTRWYSGGIIWSLQQVPSKAAALSGISAGEKRISHCPKKAYTEAEPTPGLYLT